MIIIYFHSSSSNPPNYKVYITNNLDDAGTVWSDKARLVLCKQSSLDTDHVLLWNAFCYCHNQSNLSIDSLQDCSSCSSGRNVDHRGITLRGCFCLHPSIRIHACVCKQILKYSAQHLETAIKSPLKM